MMMCMGLRTRLRRYPHPWNFASMLFDSLSTCILLTMIRFACHRLPRPVAALSALGPVSAALPLIPVDAAGQKRKREGFNNDKDGDIHYQNSSGAIVRCKRDAQINALRREFGDKLPQPFLRRKYKYIESPTFPQSQKESP